MPHTQALLHSIPNPTAVLFGLSGCLVDFGARSRQNNNDATERAHLTPGALEALNSLQLQGIPCAWLDELPHAQSLALATSLPDWITASPHTLNRGQWPSPDACWQALMVLNIDRLDGCVLVSGEPRLLQSGLNAGLWTIGLASCGSLCGLTPSEWQALSQQERELKRGKATVQLFGLGVHSVVDHLGELDTCLSDIGLRRRKGEKP
ncbi:phosphatase [Pseudomonas frederiksbergensis]|uniref:Phosphatase n=1 Tax=Pseudomonas frederiksbergensis TaxID=104087 RepID=A0A1J0EGB4_9PSED|nr:phosphatase [Pseudomonas frederiksbergensis]APC14963.1 phosphatase [Pseudomonas frederiksbergensis]